VTLLYKSNKVVAHLGDGKGSYPAGVRTTEDRSKFMPGKFVAPHGAIFDHADPGGRHGGFTPEERTKIYAAVREFVAKNGLGPK
jgi:hypothetical protein